MMLRQPLPALGGLPAASFSACACHNGLFRPTDVRKGAAVSGKPRVFISYSHDDAAHERRVLALADRRRTCGIDASIDRRFRRTAGQAPPPAAGRSRRVVLEGYVFVVSTNNQVRLPPTPQV